MAPRKSEYKPPSDLAERIAYNKAFIKGRQISEGRRFNHESYPGLMEQFKTLNWEAFLTLDGPIYPTLIEEFYANLRIDSTGVHFNLLNRDYHYTVQQFAYALGVPCQGQEFYSRQHGLAYLPSFISEPDALIDTLCKEDADLEEISKGVLGRHLESKYEDWNKVIDYNIYCKGGNHANIHATQLALLWCLENQIEVNIAYLMLERMKGVLTETTRSLPYGLHLTNLFQSMEITHNDSRPPKGQVMKKIGTKRRKTNQDEGSSRANEVPDDEDEVVEEPAPSEHVLGRLDNIYNNQIESLKKESKLKKMLKSVLRTLVCRSDSESEDF